MESPPAGNWKECKFGEFPYGFHFTDPGASTSFKQFLFREVNTHLSPHYSYLFVKLSSVETRVFLWDTGDNTHILYVIITATELSRPPHDYHQFFTKMLLNTSFVSRHTLNNSYRSSSRSLMKFGSESLGRTSSLISWEKGTLAWESHAQ